MDHRWGREMARTVSRRAVLRSGLGMAAALPALSLLGCGDDDDDAAPPGAASTAVPATASPPVASGSPSAAAGGPAWRRLAAAGAPPARRDHSITAHADGRRVYVFGGRGDGPTPFNDLWSYDVEAGSWARLSPGGDAPAPRFGHNAAFDDAGGPAGRLIVFGGQAGANFFNDVWAYDVRANAWRRIAGDVAGPRPRYGAGAAFDGASRALHVSHGFTNQGRFDDTWTLDLKGDSWADISPGSGERPVKRCLLRAIADPERRRLLLFGGQADGSPFLGDLWAFDLTARAWRRVDAAGPSPRNLYAAVRREDAPQLLLFGGRTSAGDDGDLWQLDLAADRWSKVAAAGDGPPARNSHDMTWLAGRRSLLLFGGSSGRDLNDLWELRFG